MRNVLALRAEILAEAGQIYADMAAALEADLPADSPEVEAILDRWQANLRSRDDYANAAAISHAPHAASPTPTARSNARPSGSTRSAST